MSKEDLDELLERMPKIAEAVNAFTSETVQQDAFSALVSAFAGGAARVAPKKEAATDDPRTPEEPTIETPSTVAAATPKKKRKANGSKPEWTLVKGLDLHPVGKVSFADFVAQKQPKSYEDRYAVVVYYLEQIMELPAVSINEVGTVFRLTPNWPEPTSVSAGLRVASSRKSTIDCASMEAIKTTPTGRNFVEHKLPVKVAKK